MSYGKTHWATAVACRAIQNGFGACFTIATALIDDLSVVVGVMEVLEELATWQEMRWRERRWCSIEEAGALLSDHPVWSLYDRLRPTLVAMLPGRPR